MKTDNNRALEIGEYFQEGQEVLLEGLHGEIKGSCSAVIREAAGDSLSVVLNGIREANIRNGDAVIVTGKTGTLTINLNARVIGDVAGNKVKMRLTGKRSWKDAGGDFKVHASLPFDYEKVSREDYERYGESYRSVSGDDFLADPFSRKDLVDRGEVDPALYNSLIDIEQKLNLVIRHLSLQGTGRAVIPTERDIEISASGMRFDDEKELVHGDILKVQVILPTSPISFLTFYSEVSRVLPLSGGGYEVWITYMGLNADVKDRITAYLFKKQREAIRNEKG